jgi:hypothetical protein
MAQEKAPSFLTPKGIANYPKLTVPDTKFNAEGHYSVKLQFTGDEAQELSAFLDEKSEEAVAEAKAENKPKAGQKAKPIKEADKPYSWDDDGNLVVSFKMKASGVTEAGKAWSRKPALFDAKGKPLGEGVNIGGGSTLIVSYTPSPFYTALIGAGISLRLEAVQVIDLKEYQGSTADSFGFEAQDGFEAEESTSPFNNEEPTGDKEDF